MNPRISSLFLLVVGISFAGCQKIYDYVHSPINGNTEYRSCSIRQITGYYPYFDDIHHMFSYNKYGNPEKVVNDRVGTGSPNMWFKYDKYNRLIQLIRPYSNNNYETWNKYGYNAKNQIVRDTQYEFGPFVDSVPSITPMIMARRIYTVYEYDAFNRISMKKDSNVIFNSILVRQKFFNYNSKGNLVGENLVYDDKISILRTNKIWMFLAQDYSVNNPVIAAEYSRNGLPVVFSGNQSVGLIFPYTFSDVKVDYSCY